MSLNFRIPFKNINIITWHITFIQFTCIHIHVHVQCIHIYITTVLLLYMNTYIISGIRIGVFLQKERYHFGVSISRCSNQWCILPLYKSRWQCLLLTNDTFKKENIVTTYLISTIYFKEYIQYHNSISTISISMKY